MNFAVFSIILLTISAGLCADVTVDQNFKCNPIDTVFESPGNSIYIPTASDDAQDIPKNTNCTYKFTVRKSVYVGIVIINELKDDSVITYVDGIGDSLINVNSGSKHFNEFTSVTGTGSIIVLTGDVGGSKTLIRLTYYSMPDAKKYGLLESGRATFLDLFKVGHFSAATISGPAQGKIAVSYAMSGRVGDMESIRDYYILDGTTADYKIVQRLANYFAAPFVSTSSVVTIIGMSDDIPQAHVLFNPAENVASFDRYAGVSVLDQGSGVITIGAAGQKTAATFIAKNSRELLVNWIRFSDQTDTSKAQSVSTIAGVPSSTPRLLTSYTPQSVDSSLPQLFPAQAFTVIAENCKINLTLKNYAPNNYRTLQEGKSGYIFTPSYLDPMNPATINVTLNATSHVTFATHVDDIQVSGKEELDIFVYKSDGSTGLSIIVTGNQAGGSSQGAGTTLNVRFQGSPGTGYAKVRYEVASSSFTLFPSFFLIFVAASKVLF